MLQLTSKGLDFTERMSLLIFLFYFILLDASSILDIS
jgi:hypothetical protein